MGRNAISLATLVFALTVTIGTSAGQQRAVVAQQSTPTTATAIQDEEGGISDGGWAVIAAIVGIVGTLGGTWLGHHLSEGAAKRREAAVEAKQRDSMRTLLRIEIDQNLVALKALWDVRSREERAAKVLRSETCPHFDRPADADMESLEVGESGGFDSSCAVV